MAVSSVAIVQSHYKTKFGRLAFRRLLASYEEPEHLYCTANLRKQALSVSERGEQLPVAKYWLREASV